MIHNILICDADRSLLAFHAGLLRHGGYRVATAHDAETLRTQLRSAMFSLVIAELAFPDGAGSDAVNVIRQIAAVQRRTPILCLTANIDPAARRKARTLGVWDISIKPARCTELLGLVRNILEDAHATDCGFVAGAWDRRPQSQGFPG